MNDTTRYRMHLCAAMAVFVVLIVPFLVHVSRNCRLFRQQYIYGEPAPAPPDLKRICSFDLLRDVARRRADGFISGHGTWKRNGKGVPERFMPDVCRFRRRINIPRREMLRCLKRHRLHHVVIAGDSNALRYFAAFQAFLTGAGAYCLTLKVCLKTTRSRASILFKL